MAATNDLHSVDVLQDERGSASDRRLSTDAGVSASARLTPVADYTRSSGLSPNSRLLPRVSERARTPDTCGELASQTTEA
jgi:hypothetical protein